MRTTASSLPTLDSRGIASVLDEDVGFPDDASNLLERAEQARQSRLWAGIHFPVDDEMGTLAGAVIGCLVVVRARGDGAA